MSDAAERLADVARIAAQGDDLTALATARGFEAIVEAINQATTNATALKDIAKLMDQGTSSDGYDVGILDEIAEYLDQHGHPTVDCEDL